jgi:uncharacterized protein (TIGR02757 family)
MIDKQIKYQLMKMADKYETAAFLKDDPSQFMHRYSTNSDIEVVALIAASLALGWREQILSKVDYICSLMNGKPSDWILTRQYELSFPENDDKFYRFFSYRQMRNFFQGIRQILEGYGTIGRYMKLQYEQGLSLLDAIVNAFKSVDAGQLIPRNTSSTCKRVNMFLRWMVRDNSPVDMGLWNWYDKKNLIIPVDTHVMQEAIRMSIVKKPGASLSKAIEITDALSTIWPSDPCKGDFALFGIGVNQ